MDEREREQLVEELIARLKAEGVPEGAWLVDITGARQALHDAYGLLDDLLARLEDALIQGFGV